MNCFNSIAGKFIKIIAMNPFIFYDISHKPQLRPPRLFTDVFEEEMEKRLREGMDPVLAVEEARTEAFNQTLNSNQSLHLYLEDTELPDEQETEQADLEVESILQDAQLELISGQAGQDDQALPEDPAAIFKETFNVFKSGYDNIQPVDAADTGSSDSSEAESESEAEFFSCEDDAPQPSLDASLPTASPARDKSDFEMADLSSLEESQGRQNQGFMDISALTDAIGEVSRAGQDDDIKPWSIQSMLELCPVSDDEEESEGESSDATKSESDPESSSNPSEQDDGQPLTSTPKGRPTLGVKRPSECINSSSISSDIPSPVKKRTRKKKAKPKKSISKQPPAKRPRRTQPLPKETTSQPMPRSSSIGHPEPPQPPELPQPPDPPQPLEPSQPPQEPPQPIYQQAEPLTALELKDRLNYLGQNFVCLKFKHCNSLWCWHNAPTSLLVRGIHLLFKRNGHMMITADSPIVFGSDYDTMVLELAKLENSFNVSPKEIITLFVNKYHPDNPQILEDYFSFEWEFLMPLFKEDADGVHMSSLTSLLQVKVVIKTLRTGCNCTEAIGDNNANNTVTERISNISLDLPQTDKNKKQESFTEMVAASEEEVFECNGQVEVVKKKKKVIKKCKKFKVTRTISKQYIDAPDLLLIIVNRHKTVTGENGQPKRIKDNSPIELEQNFSFSLPMVDGSLTNYKLVGCLQHLSSLDSGHYVTHLKHDNHFFLVNDRQMGLTYSHLSSGEYSPNLSHVFLYLRVQESTSMSLDLPSVNPDDSPTSSTAAFDELVTNIDCEDQVITEDKLGRKVIVKNKRKDNEEYSDLSYFFLDYSGHQWFGFCLLALKLTFEESGISIKKPPTEKLRKKWMFKHFLREVFNSKQGDVITFWRMLQKAQEYEELGPDLAYSPQSITQLFELQALDDEDENLHIMFQPLKPCFVTNTMNLFCPICKKVTPDKWGEEIESFPLPLKLKVQRKLDKGEKTITLQKLWDNESYNTRSVVGLEHLIHRQCKAWQRRVEETKLVNPCSGIVILLDKDSQLSNLRSGKIKIEIGEELKIQNAKPEAYGEHTTFELVCGIQEEYNQDVEDHSFEDILRSNRLQDDKNYSQFTIHFKKAESFFKISDCDKLEKSSKEEMDKCTLLFFKTQKSPKDKASSPQKEPTDSSESSTSP